MKGKLKTTLHQCGLNRELFPDSREVNHASVKTKQNVVFENKQFGKQPCTKKLSRILCTFALVDSVVDLWSLYHLWRFNSCCCYRYNELKLVPSSNSVLLVTCCPLHPLDTCCLQYWWYLLSSQFSWYWSSILSVKTCCLISPPDIFKFLSSPSFWYMFSSQFYWYWLSSPFS